MRRNMRTEAHENGTKMVYTQPSRNGEERRTCRCRVIAFSGKHRRSVHAGRQRRIQQQPASSRGAAARAGACSVRLKTRNESPHEFQNLRGETRNSRVPSQHELMKLSEDANTPRRRGDEPGGVAQKERVRSARTLFRRICANVQWCACGAIVCAFGVPAGRKQVPTQRA